jgi:hypothetical protein
MQDWQKDPALASVRDAANMNQLPESERAAWQKLWSDVTALRQRTQATKK